MRKFPPSWGHRCSRLERAAPRVGRVSVGTAGCWASGERTRLAGGGAGILVTQVLGTPSTCTHLAPCLDHAFSQHLVTHTLQERMGRGDPRILESEPDSAFGLDILCSPLALRFPTFVPIFFFPFVPPPHLVPCPSDMIFTGG